MDMELQQYLEFYEYNADPATEGLNIKAIGKRMVAEFMNFIEHIIAFCEKIMVNITRMKEINIPKEIYTYAKAVYQRLKKVTTNILELDEVSANRQKLADIQNSGDYQRVVSSTPDNYPDENAWIQLDSSQKKDIYNEFKYMRNMLTRTKNTIRRSSPDSIFDPDYADGNGSLEVKKAAIQSAIGILRKMLYFGNPSKEQLDGKITYLSTPIEVTV